MDKLKKILLYPALTIITIYFLFAGLVKAESFLVPLCTAIVLAFLVFPVARYLEKNGVNRAVASLVSTLAIFLLSTGLMYVLIIQVRGVADDWEEIREGLEARTEELNEFIIEKTPLERLIDLSIDRSADNNRQDNGQNVIAAIRSVMGFSTNILIVFVYIFLFIHFRRKFREFILRFFPDYRRREISRIISRSSYMSRKYLAGKLLLMVILAILYFTGLFFSGLDRAFLISLIAAALSIIPIVGNLIGYLIAIAVSMLTDGVTGTLAGITLTFALAQFIDTYILQPIVLGNKLNVHPFFIIISVILGYEVWGIMGMVLAVPIFAVITVICRNVPELEQFGHLFSKEYEKTTVNENSVKRGSGHDK